MVDLDSLRKRVISYLYSPRLIASILTAAIILPVITAVWTKDRTIKKIHRDAVERLHLYNSYLLDKVNTFFVFTKILSERPYVTGYLKHPNEQIAINEYLLQFNKSIGASLTYIMDKNGTAIAASNYKRADSVVGKKFTFREYFRKAVRGIPDEDIAIGTVTKKLGYYRSYPVRDGDEIIGVVVIKYDVNIFTPQNTDKEDIFFVTDDKGVIFHTSDTRYLYHTVHKLPENTLQKIKDNKEYEGEPLMPLPIIRQSEKNGLKFVTLRHSDNSSQAGNEYRDAEYLILGTQDNTTIWNVHLFVGLSDAGMEVKKNVFFVLLSMFMFYLIGVFLNYRAESKKVLQKSYKNLLEQKVIAEKHAKEQETINSLLKLSLSSDPLEVHLQRKLDVILSHFSQSKGCIFLYNETLNCLNIAAHRGFNEEQLVLCSEVPLGTCMCGLAAATKEIVFSSYCNDDRHTIAYDGMAAHGQYCVPVTSTDKQTDRLLGVINIYADAGYERNDEDEVFLKNIAQILAGVILRNQELQLIELGRTEGLTTIAAGIAHEINNPLSFVKTAVSTFIKTIGKMGDIIKRTKNLSILKSAPDDYKDLLAQFDIDNMISSINKKADAFDRGVGRIMEVVNGLRSFSRLNKTNEEDVDLNKCIDEALSVCLNENNKVTIVKKYGELPLYPCESRAMNQCFYHILLNAFQAVAVNDTGKIRIVTSQLSEDKGQLIQINIDDNGIGMSGNAVKHAFVPFFTTKAVGSGKGLGLSIADGIIKRHGGKISIESTEGQGTSVTIRLPLIQKEELY
ncbi:MAG: hypothetical protein HQK99_12035 [Nitrospirae bacterium]|nr:hypothetical protein [Nitrospirota bacterium]